MTWLLKFSQEEKHPCKILFRGHTSFKQYISQSVEKCKCCRFFPFKSSFWHWSDTKVYKTISKRCYDGNNSYFTEYFIGAMDSDMGHSLCFFKAKYYTFLKRYMRMIQNSKSSKGSYSDKCLTHSVPSQSSTPEALIHVWGMLLKYSLYFTSIKEYVCIHMYKTL